MSIRLRTWQKEALANYRQRLQKGARQTLWEATPGAGKTTAALQLCLHQLQIRRRKHVVVVVPTAHLKHQWAQAAVRFGIDLDSTFKAQQGLSSDYGGVSVTYQQVANQPAYFKGLSRNAVVVLDEVHHAAEGLMWGDALRTAFDAAGFVLCLSGTAFRSDNSVIPFVTYERNESAPDYVYGYSSAVQDRVCRPIAFFTYGGEISWREDGRIIQTRFHDELFHSAAARRLRTALDATSGWIDEMVLDAHKMLLETRKTHPNAGGLLVAADQDHARDLAQMLYQMSGQQPTLVLSDDNQSSTKIERYALSGDLWIVACNMVSEGVDIPRLRVGVYATTITTKMYFRQFLGRLVRITPKPDDMQVGYVYLPADERLRLLAQEIEAEQKHVVKKRPIRTKLPSSGEDDRQTGMYWTALDSTNSGVEEVIVNGQQLVLFRDPEWRPEAEEIREIVQETVLEQQARPVTKSEAKLGLMQEVKELVARYHYKSGLPYKDIYAELNRAQNVRNQNMCTEPQLRHRLVILRKMIR